VQKFAKLSIIQPEIARAISLKFCTEINDVTLDVPQTLKVSGSKVKITA